MVAQANTQLKILYIVIFLGVKEYFLKPVTILLLIVNCKYFSQVPTRRRETARRRNPKFGEGLRREKSERCKECGANYGGNMLIISTISSRDLLFGK